MLMLPRVVMDLGIRLVTARFARTLERSLAIRSLRACANLPLPITPRRHYVEPTAHCMRQSTLVEIVFIVVEQLQLSVAVSWSARSPRAGTLACETPVFRDRWPLEARCAARVGIFKPSRRHTLRI